jgi:hypothetical protein
MKNAKKHDLVSNGLLMEGYSGNATTTSVRATPASLNFSAAFAEFVNAARNSTYSNVEYQKPAKSSLTP